MKKLLKIALFFAGTLITTAFLYNYVFFVIQVPSASMYPAIEVGDRILTTRIHDASAIDRGDILVFYSDEFKETMVKRVIGMPNDTVDIDAGGNVYINNEKLDEAYVKYPDQLSGSYKVPDGKYFFLGDYRIHSMDSRKWKDPFISQDRILGEAKYILFPFSRISGL